MSSEFNCPIKFSQQATLSTFVGQVEQWRADPANHKPPNDLVNDVALWKPVQDLAGRINYFANASAQALPVNPSAIPLTPGASPVRVTFPVGIVVAFAANGAGNGSASIEEGGEGLYAGVFDALPSSVRLDQFTTWGTRAVQGLAIKAGQFMLCYSQATAPLPGQVDIRL